eukprot:1371408-Amorphochlora_amoeboformis.AAC.1
MAAPSALPPCLPLSPPPRALRILANVFILFVALLAGFIVSFGQLLVTILPIDRGLKIGICQAFANSWSVFGLRELRKRERVRKKRGNLGGLFVLGAWGLDMADILTRSRSMSGVTGLIGKRVVFKVFI